MRGQATRGKSASPNFREVGCANFPLCFAYQTNDKRVSIEAVARRASFAEGLKGARSPIVGVQRAKPFGKSEEVTTKTKPIPKSSKTKAIPQMRGCQKTENAQKQRTYQTIKPEQPRISNSAVLFMSAQSAKSEAILRRTTIKPNKGASPCKHEQTQRLPRAIQSHIYIQIFILIHSYPPEKALQTRWKMQ